jgi:tRNA threonylcarbamoyl adenosine modification protein YjeE
MTRLTIPLQDLQATTIFAAQLARLAEVGDVLLLQGDLGVGKTALCRAFIQSVQEAPEDVPSPTFTLVQIFQGTRYSVWHFDLYRLKQQEEAFELGLEDAFDSGVSLIEWPELIEALLPENCVSIHLSYGIDKGSRIAELQGVGTWEQKLKELQD